MKFNELSEDNKMDRIGKLVMNTLSIISLDKESYAINLSEDEWEQECHDMNEWVKKKLLGLWKENET